MVRILIHNQHLWVAISIYAKTMFLNMLGLTEQHYSRGSFKN